MRELISKIPVAYRWTVAALALVGTIWGGTVGAFAALKPIVDSGPLPLASREEVVTCELQVAQLSKQTTVLVHHDDYLMQEALANDYTRWQALHVQEAAILHKNPNDPTARMLDNMAIKGMLRAGKALGLK